MDVESRVTIFVLPYLTGAVFVCRCVNARLVIVLDTVVGQVVS